MLRSCQNKAVNRRNGGVGCTAENPNYGAYAFDLRTILAASYVFGQLVPVSLVSLKHGLRRILKDKPQTKSP